jgi:hypothetical protein
MPCQQPLPTGLQGRRARKPAPPSPLTPLAHRSSRAPERQRVKRARKVHADVDAGLGLARPLPLDEPSLEPCRPPRPFGTRRGAK